MLHDYTKIQKSLGAPGGMRALLRRAEHRKERFVGKPYDPAAKEPYIFTLQKPADRDFVILNFTDPHFADYDVRALMAFSEARTMRRLVKEIKPDLITVTGDLICSDCAIYSMKRICALLESFGVPWAPVFGNHEDESNMDKNYMADLFLSCPHCLFAKNDPEMGVGNYILNVCEAGRIVESLFMMDSGHSQVNDKQQAWFRENAEDINRQTGNSAEIAVMFHIPLPEYQYAHNAAWEVFERKWREEYKACGEMHENICCEMRDGVPVQRGFFPLLKETGTVKHVFCGHEHLNNFSILYQGIRLTYTMKVGKASGGGFGLNGGTEITVGSRGIRTVYQKAFRCGRVYNKEIIDI